MVQNRTFYNNFTFRVEQQQSDTVLYGFLPAPALLANDLNDSAVCWKIFKESVCTSVPDRKLKHSRNMIWSTEAGPSQSSSNGIRRRLQRFCQSPDLGSLCFSALRRSLIKTVLEKKKKSQVLHSVLLTYCQFSVWTVDIRVFLQRKLLPTWNEISVCHLIEMLIRLAFLNPRGHSGK